MSPWVPRVGLALLAAGIVAAIVSISVGEGGPQATIEIDGIQESQQLLGGIRQDGARLGVPDAPTQIEVFNDLRSIDGAEFEEEVVAPVIEEFVRTDRALILFRHYSIGRSAVTLPALAATAAGEQGRQWQFADLIFRNLENAGPRGVDEEFIDEIAEATPELDQRLWEDDFDQLQEDAIDEEIETQPEADAELGATLKLPAEPAVVVTGPGGRETLVEKPSLGEVQAAIERVSVPPE